MGRHTDEDAPARDDATLSELRAALQSKSDLIATVSHELRTPMGAIISMADLLLTTPLDETQRRYANTLQQCARSLLVLLDDVLDNEQLEAGRFSLSPRAIDFDAFLEGVETSLMARAQGAGLTGRFVRGGALPPAIEADPQRLRQILENLIDNAVKYTCHGTITLSVRHDDVRERLHVAVADTGAGMTAEETAALFKPYGRTRRAKQSGTRGTGLGLAIVARLVAVMQGKISCTSTPGGGTTFALDLPVKALALDALGAGNSVKAAAPRAALSGHALIVDDNHINQALIAAFLESFGMSHDTAADGEAALALIRKRAYSVVLMDVRMAGMDGMETTRRIRALDGPEAETPIVAITANARAQDREELIAAGMDFYVSKPIDPKALLAALTDALSGGGAKTRVG